MSSGNIVINYEDLMERSQETISNLEFDISSVIIPYSEIIKPLKKNSVNKNIGTDSYIKDILKCELL